MSCDVYLFMSFFSFFLSLFNFSLIDICTLLFLCCFITSCCVVCLRLFQVSWSRLRYNDGVSVGNDQPCRTLITFHVSFILLFCVMGFLLLFVFCWMLSSIWMCSLLFVMRCLLAIVCRVCFVVCWLSVASVRCVLCCLLCDDAFCVCMLYVVCCVLYAG